MGTKFTTIWDRFEFISDGVDEYAMPSTIDRRVKLIKNSIAIYNQKTFKDIKYINDELEQEISDVEIELIANIMLLKIYITMFNEFTSNYSMFQSEIGIKDYKAQVSARQANINRQQDIINNLVFSICEDYGGDE